MLLAGAHTQARTDCEAELQHMQQVAESWKEAMSRDLQELRLALEQVRAMLAALH